MIIKESKRVPTGYAIGFRLPDELFEEARGKNWTPSGYRITQELRDWVTDNGLVNNRKDFYDIRDYFAVSHFIMFVDREPCPDMDNYVFEYYSIAFTYLEDAMGFKLRWL